MAPPLPQWTLTDARSIDISAIIPFNHRNNALHYPLGVSTNTCCRTPSQMTVAIQVNITSECTYLVMKILEREPSCHVSLETRPSLNFIWSLHFNLIVNMSGESRNASCIYVHFTTGRFIGRRTVTSDQSLGNWRSFIRTDEHWVHRFFYVFFILLTVVFQLCLNWSNISISWSFNFSFYYCIQLITDVIFERDFLFWGFIQCVYHLTSLMNIEPTIMIHTQYIK